jgi:putative transposase
MGRPLRAAEGGLIYHVLNRGNARLAIFEGDDDYSTFEQILFDAVSRYDVRLLAYCLMPDHFHLLLYPRADGELSRFMRGLTVTHTQRWHVQHGTSGSGHVYQGRFRSFPVQADEHFLTVCQFVESNAQRARLVNRAEKWRWSSLWHRQHPDSPLAAGLARWPVNYPTNWLSLVNSAPSPEDSEAVRVCIARGRPFGGERWQTRITQRLGLESTFRPRGRPRKST